MDHPDQFNIVILDTPDVPSAPPMRSACLVPGCPCKDARFVSHRRAAFFAALARRSGETADRMVPVEPDWTIGTRVRGSFATDADEDDTYPDEAVAA
jgi:hypothetical protein